MRGAAVVLALLGACVAAPPQERERTWTIGQLDAEGRPAGHARLAGGLLWVLRPSAAVVPGRILEVREERRRAQAGETIRVRVRIHPDAPPARYRVAAETDATLLEPRELLLAPGSSGAFAVVSREPGSARVHVSIQEVIHDLDPLAPRARPR